MPFTGSHPAAILPLLRWSLPGSALVMGSIAPDMPMLLPIPAVVHFAHTLLGLLTIDLAIGVIGFALWQALQSLFVNDGMCGGDSEAAALGLS